MNKICGDSEGTNEFKSRARIKTTSGAIKIKFELQLFNRIATTAGLTYVVEVIVAGKVLLIL